MFFSFGKTGIEFSSFKLQENLFKVHFSKHYSFWRMKTVGCLLFLLPFLLCTKTLSIIKNMSKSLITKNKVLNKTTKVICEKF